MMHLTIMMIDDMIIKTKLFSKDLIVLPFRDKNKISYILDARCLLRWYVVDDFDVRISANPDIERSPSVKWR